MSMATSKTVSFTPDMDDSRIVGKKIKVAGMFSFRLPTSSRFSPVRLLKSLSGKMERALCIFTVRRRRYSSKVSSPHMGRSRSYASQVESHHAEALEDCIEFINSSSSLQRSNSMCAS